MNVRVWVGSALSFASAGFLLLLAWPAALVMGFGHPVVPVGMHLLTLGLLVGSAYPALAGLWAGLYGPRSPRPLWLRWAFVCHVSGVIGLVTGFYLGDREWAYWGGHYLAPTGLVLLGLHGIGAARLRPAGSERHLWSHLPVAGLLVTMALGALLVMDALTGKYGLYHPGTIMTHLFSGGFLFLLPLTLLPVKVQSPSTDPGGLRGTPLTLPMLGRYYGPVGAGALAVLIVTTGLVEGADGVPVWVGVLLAGFTGLWLGLPLPSGKIWRAPEAWRRMEWFGLGLGLLFVALRLARGTEPTLPLANLAVPMVLFLVAVPESLRMLGGVMAFPAALEKGLAPWRAISGALLTTACLLAYGGAMERAVWLTRSGALVGLAVLGVMLWELRPRAGDA